MHLRSLYFALRLYQYLLQPFLNLLIITDRIEMGKLCFFILVDLHHLLSGRLDQPSEQMVFHELTAIIYFFPPLGFILESQFNFVLLDFFELPRVDRPAGDDRVDGEELIAYGAAVRFEC